MKHINKIFVAIAISLLGQYAVAQPPARLKEKARKAESAVYEVPLSERAKTQYPTNETPSEVVWKRDIYRVLDLQKEKNASLYYPVQPIGKSMNLFTYIFRHILDNSIVAYEYNLDGYEDFSEQSKIDPRQMLENHSIYYEIQGEDSALVVNPSDLPSNEVLSYYIKESHYFDQRTSTYNSKVTAICPVLHRAGEFTSEVTKYPMFWLKYDEIAPLLSLQTVMSSSYNNVSTMTLDDYFTKNCYEGEIYKTVNLRNLAISQYCKDSASVKKEQQKIEKQLSDFRANLWTQRKPAADSTAVAKDSTATVAKDGEEKKEQKATARAARKKKENVSSGKSKKSRPASSGAKISVRRQRR